MKKFSRIGMAIITILLMLSSVYATPEPLNAPMPAGQARNEFYDVPNKVGEICQTIALCIIIINVFVIIFQCCKIMKINKKMKEANEEEMDKLRKEEKRRIYKIIFSFICCAFMAYLIVALGSFRIVLNNIPILE